MLKSYNELSRWYSALEPEPETATGAPVRPDTTEPVAGEDDSVDRSSASSDATATPEPATAGERQPEQFSLALDLPADATGDTPTEQTAHQANTTTESVDLTAAEHEKRPSPIEPEPAPPPPAQLAGRRSDFVGGWSDWVAEPAPGPDDDYHAELVQFPWPEAAADEYDDARVLQPSGALRADRARQRVRLILTVSVLALVLVATAVFFLLFGRGDSTTARGAAAPLHFTAGNLTADTAGSCPTERTDIVLRSAEAGGTDSGPDAVLAFQYAYYVTRSGTQARAVVTPDSDVSPAAVIQRGIDTIPVGTTHCVRITTVAADRFTVEITEFRPAGAPATYTKQTVRTALVGDRTLITGIAAG
ncbi:hypothetical protein [Nocardia alba]|uniref:DUF8176 domain-containing protein n=1 Tax=Nocardia alba TaxID=225051 RepID=A0A4R1FJM9_9NOCA|nr:hypothetical protein [Nocardia alba]TCJ95076.1 hypothetical protein DFR71_3990 [Nocardia alba]